MVIGPTVLFATHDVVTTGEKRSCFPTNLNSVAHAQWLARLALAARTAGSAAAAAAGEQIYLSDLSGKNDYKHRILWSCSFLVKYY